MSCHRSIDRSQQDVQSLFSSLFFSSPPFRRPMQVFDDYRIAMRVHFCSLDGKAGLVSVSRRRSPLFSSLLFHCGKGVLCTIGEDDRCLWMRRLYLSHTPCSLCPWPQTPIVRCTASMWSSSSLIQERGGGEDFFKNNKPNMHKTKTWALSSREQILRRRLLDTFSCCCSAICAATMGDFLSRQQQHACPMPTRLGST